MGHGSRSSGEIYSDGLNKGKLEINDELIIQNSNFTSKSIFILL